MATVDGDRRFCTLQRGLHQLANFGVVERSGGLESNVEFQGLRDESAHLGARGTNQLAHLGGKFRNEFCELSLGFPRWHSILPARWLTRKLIVLPDRFAASKNSVFA